MCEDIVFSDAQTAGAEFAEHVNNCGQEMNGNNAKRHPGLGDHDVHSQVVPKVGMRVSVRYIDDKKYDGVGDYSSH